MNPSEWMYHLNLSTMLDRNGFLDPCSRAEPRRPRPAPASRRQKLAAGAAVLVPLALAVTAILRG